MKKIIALLLLIAIPFGLIISESSKEPLLQRVEKDGFSLQAKDSLWEYVKYEVEQGEIDSRFNYSKQYQEPILFSVEGASVKDSLAIVGLIKELKEIFPHKRITYFSDFVGKDFSAYKKEKNSLLTDLSYDAIVACTFQLIFNSELERTETKSRTTVYDSESRFDIGQIRGYGWNMSYNNTKMVFRFINELSSEDRKMHIKHHFLQAFREIYHKNDLSNKFEFHRIELTISTIINEKPDYIKKFDGYISDNRFLLKKAFSKNFQEQFENYMYKTYPRRYVNIFIDKEVAKQKATGVVILIGLLIIILGFTLFWNRKFEYSFLNYFFPVLVVFMGYMSLDLLYDYMIQIEYWYVSMGELITSLLGVFTAVLVIAYIQWQFDKSVVGKNSNFGYQFVLKTIMTLFAFSLPWIISGFYNARIMETEFEVAPIFFLLPLGSAIGRGLLLYLNHFSDSLVKEKDVELSQLKEANAQAEVKLLQSQINPHFLYNALNSIATLARKDGVKTERMALSLSDLFKYTINRKGKKNSTIKDEVEMVQNYLEIEQIRFGDRLHFTIGASKELEYVKIPMFVIQPLIENAVKHGISKIEGRGEIALIIEKTKNGIEIVIEDNGPDFPDGLVSGHGLQTVFDLLRLSYGEDASMHWVNEPQKSISIHINQNI